MLCREYGCVVATAQIRCRHQPVRHTVQSRVYCPQLGAHGLGRTLHSRRPVPLRRVVAQLRPPLPLLEPRPRQRTGTHQPPPGCGTRPFAGNRPHRRYLGQRLRLPAQRNRPGSGQLPQATGLDLHARTPRGRRHRGPLAPHRALHRELPAPMPPALHGESHTPPQRRSSRQPVEQGHPAAGHRPAATREPHLRLLPPPTKSSWTTCATTASTTPT